MLASIAGGAAHEARHTFDYYADLAATFEWERPVKAGRSGFGLVVKEPVGVVGAIIPWNASMGMISMKLAPDVERARQVAGQLRSGTIGHNGFKSDYDMGRGGFKQSGIGREGGIDGLSRSLSPRPSCWTDRPPATATSPCRQLRRRGGYGRTRTMRASP